MRAYNPETDFSLLVKACEVYGVHSLVGVAKMLGGNGIQFPKAFNTDKSPTATRLDADILRAWRGYREPEPEPVEPACSDPRCGDPDCNGKYC